MSQIIDSIQVSGITYTLQGSGGNPTVELTQEQYNALVSAGTVSPTTYYIITDAEAVDMTNYYTKSQTSGATQISTALNAKQDTLTAGSGITISGNVISAEGGGGVNVVQTTGTSTTDVMSQNAVTTAIKAKADAIGLDLVGSPKKFVKFQARSGGNNGSVLNSNNLDLGTGLVYGAEGIKTLSTSGLVETSAITTSMSSASTDSQVPSAKAVYDNFGGLKLVKLSQAEYDALTTKDSNTLYIING